MNARTALLNEAESLINGQRDVSHGDPNENFRRVSGLWASYLGVEVTPVDVGWMMTLFKAARGRHDPANRDNYADAAGYVACAWDCASRVEVEPEPPTHIFRVGDVVETVMDYVSLPVGTVVEDAPLNWSATKVDDGIWVAGLHRDFATDARMGIRYGANTIKSLPSA